jgi:hypothetical protein
MCRRSTFAVAGVLLVAILTAPAVKSAESEPQVRYDDGRLTLRVEQMPIAEVLRRIGDATGATIRGDVPAGDVTVAVEHVPLTVALDTVLGSHSFMVTYGAKGALRSIDLLGAGPPVTAPAATVAPPLAAEEAQAATLQHQVPATGALAGAFGAEPLTVGRLLHAVINDQRPDVRAAARESILDAFLGHPELEAAYLSTLTPVEDTTLASLLRASSVGNSAEDWLSALGTRARTPELKRKAASVLAALRTPPAE